MNTYRELMEYYATFKVVQRGEVNHLNRISCPDEFKSQFEQYYQTWKTRLNIQRNHESVQHKKEYDDHLREMRKTLLQMPNPIKQSLQDKPVGRQMAIRNQMQPIYAQLGLGEYYDSIYKTVKNG